MFLVAVCIDGGDHFLDGGSPVGSLPAVDNPKANTTKAVTASRRVSGITKNTTQQSAQQCRYKGNYDDHPDEQ
jgi:hypothetical protein